MKRKIQNEYNIEHHIIPQTIIKEIGESVSIVNPDTGEGVEDVIDKETYKSMSKVEKKQLTKDYTNLYIWKISLKKF